MLKIAVTGQIKSGKTLVSKLLSKKLSSSLVSFDEYVNELIIKNNFEEIFGYTLNISDLRTKKQFISSIIFSDQNKKKKYEEFIWSKCEEFLKKQSSRTEKFLVLEIPLLFQSKLEKYVDKIIFVSAKFEDRKQRFLSSKNVADNSEKSFYAREESIEKYLNDNLDYIRSKTDFHITNDSTIESLDTSVEDIAKALKNINESSSKP